MNEANELRRAPADESGVRLPGESWGRYPGWEEDEPTLPSIRVPAAPAPRRRHFDARWLVHFAFLAAFGALLQVTVPRTGDAMLVLFVAVLYAYFCRVSR